MVDDCDRTLKLLLHKRWWRLAGSLDSGRVEL